MQHILLKHQIFSELPSITTQKPLPFNRFFLILTECLCLALPYNGTSLYSVMSLTRQHSDQHDMSVSKLASPSLGELQKASYELF
jgi:hypothetical protein